MIEKIIDILENKKGKDIVCYKLEDSTIADHVVVVTVSSSIHAKSIFTELRKYLNAEKIQFSYEGANDCGWIIVDMFDIVIHVFTEEKREYYSMDELMEKISLQREENHD